MVERNLAKVKVGSSRLLSRSRILKEQPVLEVLRCSRSHACGGVAEWSCSGLQIRNFSGAMAEWSCSGLQIRLRRFDSGSRLHWLCSGHRLYGTRPIVNRTSIRKICAWAVLIAMGLNGVWPVFAHAKRTDPVGEICSAHAQKPAAGYGGSPGSPDRDKESSDCALCTVLADRIPAYACDVHLFSASRREADFVPVTSLVAVRKSFFYPSEQPRAPPSPS